MLLKMARLCCVLRLAKALLNTGMVRSFGGHAGTNRIEINVGHPARPVT